MKNPVIFITIDNFRFFGCLSFEVNKNVDNLSATGKVELPLRAMFRNSGNKNTVRIDEMVEPGSSIRIEAGYRGYDINEVFNGFVSNVDPLDKVRLTIEDPVYLLRKKPVVLDLPEGNNTDITVKALLDILTEGIEGITVHAKTTDAKIDSFKYTGNAAGALATLKDNMNNLTCYFDGTELYCGGQQLNPKGTINAIYGVNLFKNNVKSHYANTNPLLIRMVGKKESGEEIPVLRGTEGGSVKTFIKHNVSDEKLLGLMADEELNRYSFDGFKGTLGLQFVPFAQPGGAVNYKNYNYKQEAEGKYFIKGVKYAFTINESLTQTLTLGAKL